MSFTQVGEAIRWIEGNAHFGEKNGLNNMVRLMRRLGDAHTRLRCVHVAGTNGKGSTCAFLDSIFRRAGLRVGLFTSPYLEVFQERIRLDGANVADETIVYWANAVRAEVEAMRALGEGSPTFFEIVTAIAFCVFDAARVDIAVIEVGLGGRLDPTNIITPLLSVITPIGLDHMKVLGDSIEAIAREKAGILKPGVPLVIAEQVPEARAVLRECAQEVGVPCYDAGEAVLRAQDADAAVFDWEYREKRLRGVRITLLGAYQRKNACTALLAASVLAEALSLDDDVLRDGVLAARWPGRLEWFPEAGVLLDGAHNPMGARALAQAVAELFPGQRPTLVVGILSDKDVSALLDCFAGFPALIVCTRPDTPRAHPPEALARGFRERGALAITIPEPLEALRYARGRGAPVVVSGSLYLVGEIRRALRRCL